MGSTKSKPSAPGLTQAYADLLYSALAERPGDRHIQSELDKALAVAVEAGEGETLNLEHRLAAGEDVGSALAEAYLCVARTHASLAQGCCVLRCLQRSLTLAPEEPAALRLLGETYFKQARYRAARNAFARADAVAPDQPEVLAWLAWCDVELLELDEALSWSGRALAIDPRCVEALTSASRSHFLRSEYDAAARLVEQALEIAPADASVRFQRGDLRLCLGDFSGWADLETRFGSRPGDLQEPEMSQPRWDGSDLAGKTILVHSEQGFGDILQFVRFLGALEARGARVTLATNCELANLLRRCEGVHRVVSFAQLGQESFDCHIPLGSLPLMLNLRIEELPYRTGYVRPDERLATRWNERLKRASAPGTFKVGLVWAGLSSADYDLNRSLCLESLAPLAGAENVQFVSLQVPRSARDERPCPLKLVDWTDELADFDDTAALVANLDLVISVDTAAAHLAGAMGVPVWTLVRYNADYRWMRERDDSPWYPTMRLFRQEAPFSWAPVMARVRAALDARQR